MKRNAMWDLLLNCELYFLVHGAIFGTEGT